MTTMVEAPWAGAVKAWLWTIAGLVLAMIAVGGATRLTDSGLSITEWKPILGAIPPFTEAHWLEAFAKYKEIPEYHLVNKGMSLEDFKVIYWWEWGHRFLGRIIGLVFALPLAFFFLKGALRPVFAKRLLGVLALGALQGGIGWYMVTSGLVDRVDVSQYRLALHLTVAFLILALLVWFALDVAAGDERSAEPASGAARHGAKALVAIVLLQVVLGAFVAGLKAGLIYNTWPSMNGNVLPEDYWALQPWYKNWFENPAATQFNHRLLAYVIAIAAAIHIWKVISRAEPQRLKSSSALVGVLITAQIVLGIATLLYGVPIGLGILHQALAAIVFAAVIRHLHIATH